MIGPRGLSDRMVRGSGRRELSDEAVRHLAEAVAAYIRKPGTRGAAFILDSKGLAPADRAAVVLALGDLEAEALTGPRTGR